MFNHIKKNEKKGIIEISSDSLNRKRERKKYLKSVLERTQEQLNTEIKDHDQAENAYEEIQVIKEKLEDKVVAMEKKFKTETKELLEQGNLNFLKGFNQAKEVSGHAINEAYIKANDAAQIDIQNVREQAKQEIQQVQEQATKDIEAANQRAHQALKVATEAFVLTNKKEKENDEALSDEPK